MPEDGICLLKSALTFASCKYTLQPALHCISLAYCTAPHMFDVQASRTVFKEINTRFPALPFTFRELEGTSSREASSSRLGIVECLSHGLLHPYPVMYEKSGELVAQFKTTVLLMPNGSDR